MLRSLIAVMLLSAGAAMAQQGYPNKPIRIVTGAVGGGIDYNARVVAQALTNALGQQAIVDNRGGGGGIIAGEMIAKAAPDGYTLMVYSSNIWLLPFLREKVPYDPIKDFAPITLVSMAPNTLCVTPSLPVKSVQDLIAMAKAQPGKLNYAHAGVGGAVHMAAELFLSMTGVNIVPVAYKANGPAYTDVMSGQVQVIFAVALSAGPLVEAGKLKALAVSSAKRTPLAPGLPTIAESGVPGYENTAMNAVFAPTGTSPVLIKRLNDVLVRWMREPETKKMFFDSGADVIGNSPAELGQIVKADMAKWAKVIKERGIHAE